MGEARSRSVTKSVSWRVLATATTTLLVFALTGQIGLAASVGSLEFVAKLALYYLHERAWQGIAWGTDSSG